MKHRKKPLIDWQRLLLNMRKVQSIQSLANEQDLDGDTLRRIARGETQEPKFEAGLKLLNAHYDKCPEQHERLLND